MAKKSVKKIGTSDARDHLEALAGQEIAAATAKARSLFVPVGAYSFSDGFATRRNIVFPAAIQELQ